MVLTRDQILQAKDLTHIDEPTPEWGGTVRIEVLKASEVQQWRESCKAAGHKLDSELLLCFALRDEQGAKMFEVEDAPALAQKSGGVIERLAVRAMLVNKLYIGAVEDSEKNSEPGQSDSSTTG